MGTPGSYKWPSKWPGDGGQRLLSRRTLLTSAVGSVLSAQKAEIGSFDFSLLDDGTTPTELFFVREHFPAPNVSSAGWKLAISGAVASPFEISYEEISKQPRKVLPVTLECAENPVGGGLVSHAEWTGFSLASVIEKAQVSAESRFVRLSGADGFSRTIPLSKAAHPDTLIAYLMNGEKLPVNHGFPLRALIPGWYGMDSVKWLRRVELLVDEDPGHDYVRQVRSLLTGRRSLGAVTAMQVKSAFSRPLDGAILVGRRFTVRGAAWAGENRVRRVEVSTDGGKSWQAARLASDPLPYGWVQWIYAWKIPAPGQYDLAVRATDNAGREQAAERDANRVDEYELNAWQTVRVGVV